jgi:tetratricopeptide (TPR) repeat protein
MFVTKSLKLTGTATSTAEMDPVANFKQGIRLLKEGYPQKALALFRLLFECEKHNPYYLSYFGLSVARAERKWEQASELCELAIHLKNEEIQFYLNLAEVFTLGKRRERAFDTLDAALEIFGEDERLRQARGKLEKRSSPLFPFFSRDHFLNRKLGKLRHRAVKRLKSEET